jgi:hypothetical protein
MRAAIYAYHPTTIAVDCAGPGRLTPLDRSAPEVELRSGRNEVTLRAGVYRATVDADLTVTGDVEVVTMRAHDHYPYPPERVLEAFPSLTRGELAGFFRRRAPRERRRVPAVVAREHAVELAPYAGGGRRRRGSTGPPNRGALPPEIEEGHMFRVTSDPTVQITVYDAMRMLRGRSEGVFRGSLPPGLYRVHLERSGTVHHEIVDHERDTELEHPGPPLQSPVPFTGAATSHDDYVEAARRLSLEDTGPALGQGPHDSRLLVFVRRAGRDTGPRTLPSEPIAVHDIDGRLVTTIGRGNAEIDDDRGYAAFCVRVAPGTYRLRATRSRRDVAITIPRGRAAHVFLADAGVVRLDELRLSLVPVGAGFEPASPRWRAMEGVLAALHAPERRLPTAARALLPDAVDEDLCFGIASAHVLWRCHDRAALGAVIERLASYREIPDVAILEGLYRLDGPPARITETPPLLRASLVLAMTRPELDASELPATCALAQAARMRLHDSVWCTWSTRTWDERWIEPTVERLRAEDRGRETAAIARSLALPPRTIEQALRGFEAFTPRDRGQPLGDAQLVVPGYTLGPVLGRGPCSTVFRATRLEDARQVAMKIIAWRGDWDLRAQIDHTFAQLAVCDPTCTLKHPHLVTPTACGRIGGDTGLWLEMDLCRGSVLDLVSDRDAPLSPREAHRWMLDALDGLTQLHTCRIVHGAIKPENLLVRDASVAVAGTALATRIYSTELHAGRASARFAPPELLAGEAPPAPASDIWSMAATFYFLLTLELPREEYAGQTQLEAAACNPIVPIRERADVPVELARCIDRALSPDRPASAAAFREQLLSLEL